MRMIIAVCLMLLSLGGTAQASWFGVDTTASYKQGSDNKYSSDNDNSFHDNQIRASMSNSYNRYDSHNDYRSFRYDNSVKDSFNTFDSSDRSDRSVKDSYNSSLTGNTFENSVGKRIVSHDIGGNVSNSVLGNLEQRIGSDFSGGFNGTAATIEAGVTNTQTFGNVNVGSSSPEKQ